MKTLRYPSYIGDLRITRHTDGASARMRCLSCGLSVLQPWRDVTNAASRHNCLRSALPDSSTHGVMMLTWPIPLLGIRTKRDAFHGMIAAPGGWRKRGETVDAAARREWREETGFQDHFLTTLDTVDVTDGKLTTSVVIAAVPAHFIPELAANARRDAGLTRWNGWRAGEDPATRLHPSLLEAATLHATVRGLLLGGERRRLEPFTHSNLRWVATGQGEVERLLPVT